LEAFFFFFFFFKYECLNFDNISKFLFRGILTRPRRANASLDARARARRLVELLLHVRLDGAVGRRVGDAREHETVAHLVVIQERLVGLVNGTSRDLARARGAGARAARVREVDAGLLGRVEDVRVVRALDGLRALRGFQGDGVSREDGAAGDLGAGGAARGDADRRADRGGGGDGESGHDSG